MTLTVVIPAYNAAGLIAEQLEALVEQQFRGSWEVVVADNGSTDRTVSEVESFASRLPLRAVDASARRGPAAACNIAVSASTGESILFLDADDVVAPGYLSIMQRELAIHDFVASRLDCDFLNPGWARQVRTPAQTRQLGCGAFKYGYRATLGVRRASFEAVGGFDESLQTAEDIDFCYRMALAGFDLVYVPDAVLRYRFRDTLIGTVRQAYAYGIGAAEIHSRYKRFGEKAPGVRSSVRQFVGLARTAARSRHRGDVARCAYTVANRVGWSRAKMTIGRRPTGGESPTSPSER